jgi:pyruvate dehydrogenase E2 component (dihydrolipoamide acetyltransferase)
MGDIVMPRLSDTMEEGTILRWLKQDGERVRRGEELVEIETDKATMSYESDQEGVVETIAREGDTLAVGEVIARVGTPSRGVGGDAALARTPASDGGPAPEGPASVREAVEPSGAGGSQAASRPARGEGEGALPGGERLLGGEPLHGGNRLSGGERPGGERIKASPLARRIARESGVDLHTLRGTGPGGRIVRADVVGATGAAAGATASTTSPGTASGEAGVGPSGAAGVVPEAGGVHVPKAGLGAVGPGAPVAQAGAGVSEAAGRPAAQPTLAERVATAKGETTTVELSRAQQTIARRMAESKATIPDFTLQAEVDMEECVKLRTELKRLSEGEAPTYNDMVVKACALALREHPRVNGTYRDGVLQLHSRVNVGLAVAVEEALVVPTVFDADEKSLGEIAREARALAEKVRAGTITPPELGGGTFTVSNLGMYGVRSFTAIINPPQAAILSVGSLAAKAAVREGEVLVRHMVLLTLACDHRILYGADAAQFLARIRELLEAPAALTL